MASNVKGKLLKRARYRAKKKGQAFDIEEGDIVLPSYCPILGIELHVNEGKIGGRSNSPTLDRIDNDKGYVKGNVWVISQLANQMKSNANSSQLRAFARWLLGEYE